ncbi:PD-(D/E)XK nuclease-like domain-containing protein [Lentilactobacillus rapi]|nr:PD-(D/E)XK nuclease-like domain-containing protein [Lentilactobacillus rapi]
MTARPIKPASSTASKQPSPLKQLRTKHHLTLTELQDRVGIKRGTLSNYELGKTEPKLSTWKRLADFFNVSLEYLQGSQPFKNSGDSLTKENYYTTDQDWQTQSKSWFWKFEQCEAEALAELKGDWASQQDETPLLVGNYLHSYFESQPAHEKFIDDHAEDICKYGKPEKGLKKQYLDADKMIKALDHDPTFKQIYQGDKEVIVTGTLFGVKWRGKIDCLDLEHHMFYDLKTVDDFHKKHWLPDQRTPVSFAEARGYDMQMAVYKELIKQTFGVDCTPLIIAVSKQRVPDKALLSIPDYLMDQSMEKIEADQPHIQAVKEGREKPRACGHCDYCRANKVLNDVVDIDAIPFY